MELTCTVQRYDWGKPGGSSLVAQFAQRNDSNTSIDEAGTYAELWMGTHPSGPSIIKSSGQKLSEWISAQPSCLGANIQEKFGNELPFLFKILSINKALSIQAHPAKAHAEMLFKERPDIYKDSNHKPELAIALTSFQALCGFRPICKIMQYIKSVPELAAVIDESARTQLLTCDEAGSTAALKECFHSLMSCDKSTIQTQLTALITRLGTLDEQSRDSINGSLLERIHDQFPGDVGCFCIFLMNDLTLQPGEAVYLGPNEPHAYLSGDCMECMACSDNVVRAGLTPKYIDVDTLCDMLTYICEPASKKCFMPHKEDEITELFQPPVPDFAVAKIQVPSGMGKYNMIPRHSASILAVMQGEATTNSLSLAVGSVVFLAANDKLELNVGQNGITLYQALANV